MDEREQKRLTEEQELERKLDELDRKVTPAYLRKRLKLALYKKVEAGDVAALDDIKKLEALEKTPPSKAPSSSDPATAGEGAPASGEEEVGIPQHLRVKRRYTLSEAAIEQRRQAARKSRPEAEGNKNAWKHGKFAKDFITGRIKPCLSTCPNFDDCELVNDGYTTPGGVCLDKAAVIATYSAIMEAVRNRQHDDFNEVAALTIAETMHVSRMLIEDIMRDGSVVKRERYDKEGRLQLIEYVSHPSLMALPKLIADLGLTPRELMITPKALKDDKNDEEKGKTLAGIMSDLSRRARDRDGKLEGEADE